MEFVSPMEQHPILENTYDDVALCKFYCTSVVPWLRMVGLNKKLMKLMVVSISKWEESGYLALRQDYKRAHYELCSVEQEVADNKSQSTLTSNS